MTLQNLRKFSRLLLQNLKANQLQDPDLDIVIKAGVVQVASDIAPLTKSSYFNVEEDKGEYLIQTVASDYLGITESGLYWNSGTGSSPNWKQLTAKTEKWLDDNVSNWRSANSADPQYYYMRGAYIGVHPTPDTALTNGFRLPHTYKPTEMTAAGDYPFEGATLIPHLEMLDDCILDYVKWRLTPVSGEQELENPYEAAYLRGVDAKKRILGRRPDISNANKYSQKQAALRPRRYGRG